MGIDHATGFEKGGVTSHSPSPEGLSDAHWVSRFERLSRTFSVIAIVIAGEVLLGGYALGISGLQNLAPGLPKMMPNTALGLLLSAISLFLYTTNSEKHRLFSNGWMQRLLAVAVALLGAATIMEYLLGIDLGIDELLLRDLSPGATYPGRPSPQTSLCFILSGISLMLLGDKRLRVLQLSQMLGVIVGFMAIIAVVGYTYSALPLYGLTTYTGMAIHTAIGFLAISGGIIFAKSERGLAAVFSSRSEGGHMARRLLPAIIVVPIILGILSKWGERIGLFSTATGIAADVSLHIVLLGAELWLFALFLERSNVARDNAIQTMHRHAAQLEATNQELQALSNAVPRNLLPPLTNIAGISETLWEAWGKRLDEQGKQSIRSIQESVKKAGYLIDDLLKLSQVTSTEMRCESVDLSKLAEELLSELTRAHPEHKVENVIAPGLVCEGDSSLLRLALENLIGNAWKYSAKASSPRIEMGVTEINGDKTFFVRDNGIGFDMSYADKLFLPFQRLHNEDEFPGTGIGLAIVQRVVHRHEGRVWAMSKANEGATFYFTLG